MPLYSTCGPRVARWSLLAFASASIGSVAPGQQVTIDLSPAGQRQVIEGFGTCLTEASEASEGWWQEAYLDTLGASLLRVDLVPRFRSPYSDYGYYSPWFRGFGQAPYALNFEINASHEPRHYLGPAEQEFVTVGGTSYYNGPDGNRARTYTSATDYGRVFAGFQAPIAVMGPNLDDNIARSFASPLMPGAKAVIDAAKARDPSLRRFKLIGSIWSPAPWLKVPSGNVTGAQYGSWPFGATGTPFPYIATDGNFVGGRLDVSESPIAEFDDSGLPADAVDGPNAAAPRGPTSALTQFARGTAAYLRAVQNELGTRFYAISIQNELNFETFYNSCTYPRAEQYLKAVRYVRAELDKYEDLRGILIMGPEDLLADSTYSLWQYGGGSTAVHKNLQYLQAIEADPQAREDVALYCIHGYAADGASSAGADPVSWDRWARGWTNSPAAGLPANVSGFTQSGKRSWMTETSGEDANWISPSSGYPNDGAFSIAVKIHQALTTGQQSAWLYWQFSDGETLSEATLTDATQRGSAAKLTAARHFFSPIRPGARRVETAVTGSSTLLASSYEHPEDGTLVAVLINTAATAQTATLVRPAERPRLNRWTAHSSTSGALWQTTALNVPANGSAEVPVPAYGVVTLVAEGTAAAPTIELEPLGFTLPPGSMGRLRVVAVGPGLAYQWYRNGSAITGATNSSFLVSAQENGPAAGYHVEVRNAAGARSSDQAVVTVAGTPRARLANLSVRSTLATEQTLIVGMATQGGARGLLARAVGPGLAAFDVPNAMGDPQLELYEGQLRIATNDDWGGDSGLADVFAESGAFALSPASQDAAFVRAISGNRTLLCTARAGGNVLVEVFEAAGGANPRLINLSARNRVGANPADWIIAGFAVAGEGSVQVLIRAVGPQLQAYGVGNYLNDPKIDVYHANTPIASNDTWSDAVSAADFEAAGAFSLSSDGHSAALKVTVEAGQNYSVHVSGADGGAGEALVEIYELP